MDGLSESAKSVEQNEGFVKHVFKFDDSTKKELLNIIQYAVLSVIPVVILNKSVQKLIPEADEEKGSIEILAEVLTQLIIMFLGMFFRIPFAWRQAKVLPFHLRSQLRSAGPFPAGPLRPHKTAA